MKLHLGCGARRIPNYINIDIREDAKPDMVADITTLHEFEDGSVDVIYCCHGIEHIKRDQQINVLTRWKQLLKTNGVIRLAVPDFEAVVYAYQHKIVPFEKLWSSLNGSQRHEFDIHYHCYDFNSLKAMLEIVGFYNICRYDWRKTEHAEIDDYSQAYWPHMDKQNGFHLSLNVEGIKLE